MVVEVAVVMEVVAVETNTNKQMGNGSIKEDKPYMANALGFIALMAFFTIATHSCCQTEIEREKTKQIEIQSIKK